MTGGIASLLTWSFFVLCTPIADAGFLLDLPLRLLFNIRMVISEILVWVIAITLNIVSIIYCPQYYETTALTKIFYVILNTPYPYWSVILLSGIGTFLSIIFGDELMDIINHDKRKFYNKHKFTYKIVAMISIFIMVIILYYELIETMDITWVI